MFSSRSRAAAAIIIGAFTLAACNGGGGSIPASNLTTQSAATSTAPSLAWSPSPKDYGTLQSGDSQPQTFTLTNSGGTATSALKIALTIATGSAGFTLSNDLCSGTSLGKGKSCSVSVTYAFTSAGETDTATLSATSNKPAAKASVALSGKSAAPAVNLTITQPGGVNCSPTPSGPNSCTPIFDFGNVSTSTVGGSPQPFTVRNTGTATSTTLTVALHSDDTSFTLVGDACTGSTLAPNASCSFTVIFAPTMSGLHGPVPLSIFGTAAPDYLEYGVEGTGI